MAPTKHSVTFNGPIRLSDFRFSIIFIFFFAGRVTKVRNNCFQHVRRYLCHLTHFSLVSPLVAPQHTSGMGCSLNQFCALSFVSSLRHLMRRNLARTSTNMLSHVLQCVWVNSFIPTSTTFFLFVLKPFWWLSPLKHKWTIKDKVFLSQKKKSFNWLRDWMSSVVAYAKNERKTFCGHRNQWKRIQRKTEFFSLHRAEMLFAPERFWLTVRYRLMPHSMTSIFNGTEWLSM